jgi:hypothetical protein
MAMLCRSSASGTEEPMQRYLRRALVVLVATAVGVVPVVAAPSAGAGAAHSGPVGSNPLSGKDFLSLYEAVDGLESMAQGGPGADNGANSALPDPIDELVALVPQSVYDAYPDYDDLIRGTVVYSGASIPPCVAQGTQLLPGLPPPYGHFAPATTNNWCLPNGPNGGCDVVPDHGWTFDFRGACRQHDLGYQFAPTSQLAVDARFLLDMGADCARRGGWRLWQQPYCYTRAAIMYAAVTLLGWTAYGNSPRPGYNRPVPPTGVPPLPATTTCLQNSHASVYYPPGGTNLPRGADVYLAGVVRVNSRIRFEFRTAGGMLLASHLTYFAQENCVVEYESEEFDTSVLPLGPVVVTATFPRWEASDEVTQQLGTFTVTAGGGSTTCEQYSHAWVHPGGYVTQGQFVYPTGVVRRDTRASFTFRDAAGTVVATHLTQPARSNCVIHHEPEAMSTWALPVGPISVTATYVEWESDHQVTVQVGGFHVVAPPPGGGGGEDPPSGCGYEIICPEEPPIIDRPDSGAADVGLVRQ